MLQHISFNRKIFSSYTSVQGEEVFMKNSTTSNVIDEKTIQFRSHDECITTLQDVCHVLESRYISSLLKPYIEKGSVSD